MLMHRDAHGKLYKQPSPNLVIHHQILTYSISQEHPKHVDCAFVYGQTGDMQVAAFLSDLKSLSVCSHEAALGLVSVYKIAVATPENIESDLLRSDTSDMTIENSDRKRADELALLHRSVKLKHVRAPDTDLAEARAGIRRILQDLDHD